MYKTISFILILLSFNSFLNAQNWAAFPLNQTTTWLVSEDNVDFFFADSTYVNENGENIVLLNTFFYDEKVENCKSSFLEDLPYLQNYWGGLYDVVVDTRPDTIVVSNGLWEFISGIETIILNTLQAPLSTEYSGFDILGDSLFFETSDYLVEEFCGVSDSIIKFHPKLNGDLISIAGAETFFTLSKNHGLTQFVNPFENIESEMKNYAIKGFQKLNEIQHGFIASEYDLSFKPECAGDKTMYIMDFGGTGNYPNPVYEIDSFFNIIETDTSFSYDYYHKSFYSSVYQGPYSKHISFFNPPTYLKRNNHVYFESFNEQYQNGDLHVFISSISPDDMVIVDEVKLPSVSDCEIDQGQYGPWLKYSKKQTIGITNCCLDGDGHNWSSIRLAGLKKCDYQEGILYNVSSSYTHLYNKPIEVYPSIVSTTFNINLPKGVFGNKIEVFNSKGQLVKTFHYQQQLDISSLNSGLYYLKVTSENQLYKAKFVKL